MKKTLLLTISLLAVISLSAQRYQMKGDIGRNFALNAILTKPSLTKHLLLMLSMYRKNLM